MNPWSWSRDPWSWFWFSKSFTSPWNCRIPIWKKITFKGAEVSATVSNYGLRYPCKKINWRNANPAKCSFVPSFLFKLGSNLGKSKHINTIWEERIEKKNNLWYWICVWDQGVFSKEWTRFLFKLCVFCSCCTWWKLHVAMWSGAPWNPHALCAGPKALHRNCCPCCTMLHRCEPHWVAPKKNVRLAAKCFQSNGKWFWKPAGKVQYISWWFTAPKLNKQIWACFLWWG